MSAPATVQELVRRFNDQLEAYHSNRYTEIDKLVYELYGLTEEEVRIVEGG